MHNNIFEFFYMLGYLLNHVQYILVIYKFNIAPTNFFFCIFFLLRLENMLFKG